MMKRRFPIALILLCVSCTSNRAFRAGTEEELRQQWDLAVLQYAQAAEMEPGNQRYRISLQRAKIKASQFHFEKGKLYRASGRPELALVELQQAIVLDPTNQYAEIEMKKAQDEAARAAAERAGETKLEALKRKTKGARARPPALEPASDRPISLNFPQPKPIKQIYQSLGSAAGINVIFDPQLKDENVSIVLSSVRFQSALETLMRQENHFYKIIDEKTILVAADTPQNRKTYEDLVIRTFFLSNADVTEVSNALRALLQTTRISINKAENSITLRDTADKVAIAERIVDQNDKQLAEVVVDVELIQLNTAKAIDLGFLLGSYSTTASAPAPGGNTNFDKPVPTGTFTWDQLKELSVRSFGFTIPSVTYTFIKNNSDAELLAKPQLRISEGQKAQLVIGDRVPIPTTTFNTGTTVGGNIVPVTSFQYQDVGIKIDVEPRVHHNKEVTLKLTIEVSQVTERIQVGEGQPPQPVIGTRTISSTIRLKDGETNFLAGLYRTDRSVRNDTVPFLGDIPVIGRLFSKKFTDNRSTDVVLTLTPHIIRIPDITEEDLAPVYVGTDQNISYQGTPRIESPAGAGPFDIQRRQVPPQSQPAQPVAPVPQNLAPGGMPNDPFRPPPQTTPNPREQVPPQPDNRAPVPQGSLGITAAASPPAFDFEPVFVSLGPGQQRSVLVRATGDQLAAMTLAIRFDPAVAAVVSVRPIVDQEGAVAQARIEGGRAILELPDGQLSGTRAIAEITVQGVAPGRAALSFEGVPGGNSTVEVR